MDRAGIISEARLRIIAPPEAAAQETQTFLLVVPFAVEQLDLGDVSAQSPSQAVVLARVKKTVMHGLSGDEPEALSEATPVILKARGTHTLVQVLLPRGQSEIDVTLHGVGMGALSTEGAFAVFRYCPSTADDLGMDTATLLGVAGAQVIWACDTYRVLLVADGTRSIPMEQKGSCYEAVLPIPPPPRPLLTDALVWVLSSVFALTAALATAAQKSQQHARVSRNVGFGIELCVTVGVWIYWAVAGAWGAWLAWPIGVSLVLVLHFTLVQSLGSIN